MSRTTQILAIVTAVIFVGTVSLTVVAMGSEPGETKNGFLQHFHGMARHFHGGGHHQDGHPMGQLIEQLDLAPDQQKRLGNIHEIIGSFGNGGDESMLELHDSLIAQYEKGYVGTEEIRGLIDQHLEQIRSAAYAVTDELVALVNELDANQREMLLQHLQGGDRANGHGHGH